MLYFWQGASDEVRAGQSPSDRGSETRDVIGEAFNERSSLSKFMSTSLKDSTGGDGDSDKPQS